MSHTVWANLLDLQELSAALNDLQWYTSGGGYQLVSVTVEGNRAAWTLEVTPKDGPAPASPEKRRVVQPGDQVIVETKGQQMARRFGGAEAEGVEGTVSRVLTRGPHPHGMKVELRDRTVGRVKKNLTAPGAGEPTGRGR